MKGFLNLFAASAAIITASQAAVVELWDSPDCTGGMTVRNVWDNTCAYTKGFQSLRMTNNGGANQILWAYSPQSCDLYASPWQGCVAGIDSIPLGQCYNMGEGCNALGSWSDAGDCPN